MKGVFEKKEHLYLSGRRVQGFHGYPPMFHTHAELLYVISGSIRTTVDGIAHTLCAGELMVVFPYLTHSYEEAPDTEAIVILFDPAVTAFDNTLITKKPVRHYSDGQAYFTMLDRAAALIQRGRIKTALGYLNAVIGELLEIMPLENTEGSTGEIAVRILEYCTEHFCEDITIKRVAEALYVSQSYVSKVFCNKLKYGFREYLNYLRINKAKTLLKDSDKKIVDVMFECGFQNQSSFNRIFRSICGISPKEYRHSFPDA